MSTLIESPLPSQEEGEEDPASHSAAVKLEKRILPLYWKP
jgi:hypothetical protein